VSGGAAGLVPSAPRPVRTAVVPAGGLGTRFLPITRSLPKELLPLVDRPIIDIVVSECAAAGIERVVVVLAPGKESLAAYFRPSERLERRLAKEGRSEELAALRRPELLARVEFVVQEEPRGNGHAVLVAREAVGSEPFAMVWGDDIVFGEGAGLPALVAARERLGGSVAAAMRVEPRDAGRYGIIDGDAVAGGAVRVRRIVEKPPPGEAPSELAAVHAYVLEPEIFDILAELEPGRGGEIWLSDALARLAARAPLWAVPLAGTRYDAGDRTGYVAAFVDAALARPDTGPALREHLRRAGWRDPAPG
jgi:UTP--glucose-1-phosphate uridylyltransferase